MPSRIAPTMAVSNNADAHTCLRKFLPEPIRLPCDDLLVFPAGSLTTEGPMRKAILAFVLAVCGAVGFGAAGTCAQADGVKPAGLVVDAESGQVLVANRANAAWYPASLTKLMTAYLVFDELKA